MTKKAAELEAYMKANRPWTDRTGNARAGLKAELSTSKAKYSNTIALSHSVWYGVFLEYAMEKRFAIIEPTIRLQGPKIVSDLQGKIGSFINVKEVHR